MWICVPISVPMKVRYSTKTRYRGKKAIEKHNRRMAIILNEFGKYVDKRATLDNKCILVSLLDI